MSRRPAVNYLLGAVPAPSAPVRAQVPKRKPPPPNLARLIYTPHDLSRYFQSAYRHPSKAQLAQADALFYNSKVSHEWTCIDYDQIPDVKYLRLQQEREYQLARRREELQPAAPAARTSFGIEPTLLRPLPEVLFVGHTNAGKSTLINSLLLSKHDAKTPNVASQYAYVSAREGYTKCLNCYNVGNKIRLVDSPGYGRFGQEAQGKAVLDYLRQRRQLRRTFLLVDSLQGLRDEDATLVDHFTEHGIPFEVIMTKVDELTLKTANKVAKMGRNARTTEQDASVEDTARHINTKLVEHFQRLIDESGLGQLASLPRILFNNSHSNKLLAKRHGFHEIRHAVAESCGLVSDLAAEPMPEVETKRSRAVRSLRTQRVT